MKQRRTYWLLSILFISWAGSTFAQEPIIESTLTAATVVPGQPATLRITVLVPTYMPKPIEFPDFDQPNLLVTSSGRSSVAISRNIQGNTWSGVMRDYRILPLAAGKFRIGGASVKVTYIDPATNQPRETSLPIKAVDLTAQVPPAAADLKPFIAASDLELDQSIDGDAEKLRAGDSFSRTVTATITGSTAMFLPQMLSAMAPAGLAAYPDSPQASDNGNTGKRIEKVSYVAEGAVHGDLPAVEIRWYDLDDQQVKTTTLEAIKVRARGVRFLSRLSQLSLLDWAFVIAALLITSYICWEWIRPELKRMLLQWRRQYELSSRTALKKLHRACKEKDYSATLEAARDWQKRGGDPDKSLNPALFNLGAHLYGPGTGQEKTDLAWRQLQEAINVAEKFAASRWSSRLPPLNP